MRVLIADDDRGYRKFVRRILEMERDMVVVAEAADGEEAVRLAQELNPDLILMDIDMPRLDGLQATRRLKAHQVGIQTRVLVFCLLGGQTYRDAAVKYGADAFLPKDAPISQILSTIRKFSPQVEAEANQTLWEAH